MKLSIIIPVYNEEKTIVEILDKVKGLTLQKTDIEIIVIDDGSTDKTKQLLRKVKFNSKNFKHISHKKNLGKGAAVRTGLSHATGNYVIIQDADLEYNPQDIASLIIPILKKRGDVAYGTRLKRLPHFRAEEKTVRFAIHYTGNKLLSLLTTILYGQRITDMETCYKLFPKYALENIVLRARGFEFEPEITAKLIKQRLKIIEIPITTSPRGYKEGKKLRTIHDGLMAVSTLIKYRFVD